MIKRILLTLALYLWQLDANGADLLEVYQRALCSDPVFKQVIAQTLVTKDNVPISISAILPKISLFADPTITRYHFSGTKFRIGSINGIPVFTPRNLTQQSYTLDLNLTQPIFNMKLFDEVAIQLSNAKSACATLNYALQNLMVRVSKSYFAVVRDEEYLVYALASMRYYHYQLDHVKHQFEVGLRTITDVYTAQAAYDSSVAAYVVAKKELANARENLRVITGCYYPHLSYLKNDFPLILPEPNDVNCWVKTALTQNWAIRAAQYSLEAAKQNIRKQFAGHLPTITLESNVVRKYAFNIDRYPSSYIDRNGAGTISSRSIGLALDFPIFEGGGVVAKTNQALHLYQEQQQIFEEIVRNTINDTRQSFMNIVALFSQIKADLQIIKSAGKSLQGTIASFNAGNETLIDVLSQEEKLYQAQINYATNRYEFVNNIFLLKNAAGTLSVEDLCAINRWLIDDYIDRVKPFQEKLLLEEKKARQPSRQQNSPNQQNKIQNQTDTHLQMLIDQVSQEARETYKKLENQNQQSTQEITKLKAALSKLSEGLQDKENQLKMALQKVSQLKGNVKSN